MIASRSARKTPDLSNNVYLSENIAETCDRTKSVVQKAILNLPFFFSLNSMYAVIKLKVIMIVVIKFKRNEIVRKMRVS